jgi:FkbM family methyltransferase
MAEIMFNHIAQDSRQSPDGNITVFDIGCRFGIHPTWTPLKSAEWFRYYAFDVDDLEIDRLRQKYCNFKNYYPIHIGFSDAEESAELNVLSHHGQSSFFKPKLNSIWFSQSRPYDGKIEKTKKCTLTTLDKFVSESTLNVDFLKIDTEGYDFRILKGAEKVLETALAVRCEVHFTQVFDGAESFSTLHDYMTNNGFELGNIDYDGRGLPLSYFCPNPKRYGFLSGTEAVYIKNSTSVENLPVNQRIKLVLFGFFNNLEDFSHRLLLEMAEDDRKLVSDSKIWTEIERQYCLSARKLMYLPGDFYTRAVKDFQKVFSKNFPERHTFFESDFLNPP